ncbi:MAG: hypothetical protein WC467_04610 [Patescibacteria group bacterium]
MRKHLSHLAPLLILTALLILPYFVFAQSTNTTTTGDDTSMLGKLNTVAGSGGYNINVEQAGLMATVGIIIQAAIGLLGAIFLIIMVVAGYQWMTASGNEQRVEKAQSMIKRAIIGLVITLSSYAIWSFIFQKLILRA